MINLSTLTIKELHKMLVGKEITVREICDMYLKEINEKNKDINAYVEVYSDIDEQINKAQKMIDDGNATEITGIPVSIKDNMMYIGHVSSCGSHILENYHATYTGTVVQHLLDNGAILLGRTNMDEFAMGSSTETSYFGITKNPLDTNRVPGGSSGGAAASVAMNGALVTLGSDTGGSIRQPAAYCGLVGLKPTYGGVSRYGITAMGSSLDQIGPIGKTVSDVEIIHNIISKYDPMDATSVDEVKRIKISSEIKRIGVPVGIVDKANDTVRVEFLKTIELLKGEGYEMVDVSLPYMPYSLAVYYILMPAESSTNLSRFDGIRFGYRNEKDTLLETYLQSRGVGFGKEVQKRILLGTYVLSHGYFDAFYNKALKVQKAIKKEFEEVFKNVDIIVTPTTPSGAFKFGEKSDDPVSMYLCDIFAVPANIAGIPAISVPKGLDENNMPLGIQFMAPMWGENRLFNIGRFIENNNN